MSSYKNASSRLDEQLLKLKECKTEMSKLFTDLDKMIDTDREYEDHNYEIYNNPLRSHQGPDNDNYTNLKNESHLFYSSDDEKSCSYRSEYRCSDSETDEQYYAYRRESVKPIYKPARISFSYRSTDPNVNRQSSQDMNFTEFDLEQLIKSAETYQRTDEERMQYNYLIENMNRTNNDHYKKYESSRISSNKKISQSRTSMGTNRSTTMARTKPNKIPNISVPKPKWMPNGKIKQTSSFLLYRNPGSINKLSNVPTMYRSTSSINKSSTSLNHNLAKNVWQPSGKVRPKSALFYSSSHELRRSEDLEKSLKKLSVDIKDVGKGWKPCGKVENQMNSLYFTDQDFVTYKCSDAETVKKKKEPIKDPKDIGEGWKKIGKMKIENYFKTDPDFVRLTENEIPANPVKKIDKNKDIGDGWKPTYNLAKKNIRFGMYSKPPIHSKLTSASSSTKTPNDQAKSGPEKTLKKWIPSPKLKAVFPNTWMPPKESDKPAIEGSTKLSKLTKLKQRISMFTSTPNMSIDAAEQTQKVDDHINQSIIDNKTDSNQINQIKEDSVSTSKINASNSKNKSPDESKNGSSLKNLETDENLNNKLTNSMLDKTIGGLNSDKEIESENEQDDEDLEFLENEKQFEENDLDNENRQNKSNEVSNMKNSLSNNIEPLNEEQSNETVDDGKPATKQDEINSFDKEPSVFDDEIDQADENVNNNEPASEKVVEEVLEEPVREKSDEKVGEEVNQDVKNFEADEPKYNEVDQKAQKAMTELGKEMLNNDGERPAVNNVDDFFGTISKNVSGQENADEIGVDEKEDESGDDEKEQLWNLKDDDSD